MYKMMNQVSDRVNIKKDKWIIVIFHKIFKNLQKCQSEAPGQILRA